MRKSGPYLSLGTSLAAPVVVLALFGRWLDVKWGTEPWLLLAGSLLGMVTGFYSFFRTVLRQPPDGGGGSK